MARTYRVASEDLAPAEAEELRRLVDEAGLLDGPDVVTDAGQTADVFTYTITVRSGDRATTVTTSDTAIPEALEPLLAWLSRHVRTSRPGAEEE